MSASRINLGTRRSNLAMWQTQRIAQLLFEAFPNVVCDTTPFHTTGDTSIDPIGTLGTIGVFTLELESALHSRQIDAAVHSLKDLPTRQRDGLTLGAICQRSDARDALISNKVPFHELAVGAKIGTSSPRRAAQIRALRPDLCPVPMRGNVETRLNKVRNGEFDAAVMASAGLTRLGFASEVTEIFPVDRFVPAPGQGALAVQCRADDERMLTVLSSIDEPTVRAAVEAERAFLATLEGGCTAPIGAYASIDGDDITLIGVVLALDGSRQVTVSETGKIGDAVDIGGEAARRAFDLGARKLAL